jgi:hypothetical protein
MTQADFSDSARLEAGPDSRDLRVGLGTPHESGIPPVRERLVRRTEAGAAVEQLELVLVESTRAEANLGLFIRGLKHLAAGASAAQEANAVLVQELEALRHSLDRAYESESVLQQRVTSLENALFAAARERESWLVQEDAFLAGLLDEHEQKVFELERKHERQLAELDLAFDELRLQYEGAKVELQRLTYERDAAVALLNEPSAEADVTSPLAPSVRPTTARPSSSARPSGGYSMTSDDRDEEPATARPLRL